jgi:uncharacterized membrane protein YkoI
VPERRLLAALALIALLAVGAAAAADEYDHDEVRRLREQGKIVPLQALIEDAGRRYGAGRLLEAELEQRDGYGLVYEIEFLAADGQKRELYYDAASGELLIYEVYETDARGRLRSVKYDARTGRRLDDDDEDDD